MFGPTQNEGLRLESVDDPPCRPSLRPSNTHSQKYCGIGLMDLCVSFTNAVINAIIFKPLPHYNSFQRDNTIEREVGFFCCFVLLKKRLEQWTGRVVHRNIEGCCA